MSKNHSTKQMYKNTDMIPKLEQNTSLPLLNTNPKERTNVMTQKSKPVPIKQVSAKRKKLQPITTCLILLYFTDL